jgi:hypothetical protein
MHATRFHRTLRACSRGVAAFRKNSTEGRQNSLSFIGWCNEPAELRIRVLFGQGGTGKSRLAFELAETLRAEGWQAGQLADPARPVAIPPTSSGILLIIHYPEQFLDAVEKLLRLIKNSELPGIRLRLLLLSRNPETIPSRHNFSRRGRRPPPTLQVMSAVARLWTQATDRASRW